MRRRVTGAVGLAGICAAALVTATAPTASGSNPTMPSVTPVLSGLAAPRGIAFDGQGSMYVAESGTAGPGQAGTTQTGRVSKYAWGSSTPAWSTSFTSFYAAVDPSQPPDALGPEGISAVGSGCMDNSHGQRNGCQVLMIMSESTPGISHESDGAISAPQAGHLYRLDGVTGTATDRADVGSQMYAWTGENNLFEPDFPDSNPYAVLVTKGGPGGIRTFVADAGANTISEVMRDGSLRVVAYIPNETAPPFRDSTPTCIAQGPDGYLYVGTLHLVANVLVPGATGGLSDVWRVNPDATYPAAPEKWASGLTTVSACTFDRAGNFWATEMFAGGFTAVPAPGDVVEIPFAHPDQQTHLGAGQVLMPGGIAQGPDGAMYVTTMSAVSAAPAGGVVRIG